MKSLRLVLDTNVVLDLLHYGDPQVAELGAMLADGRACCFVDARTFAELERVLAYPALRLTPEAADSIVGRYGSLATVVATAESGLALPRCRDADDQKFLELAATVGADFLLTRDRQLLKLDRKIRSRVAGLQIMTPQKWSKYLSAPGIDGAS